MQAKHNLHCKAIVILICLPLYFLSQTNKPKIILDSKTRFPIDFVYISSDDKKINLLSTKDGKFILLSDNPSKSFLFYKIGYYPKTIEKVELVKKDTIFLEEDYIGLKEITVTPHLIDTIVHDKRFYVNDYIILPNNDFLILSSKINFKGFEVAYFKKDKGITCLKKIKLEKDEHFFVDCFKNIHLVTNNFSRQIFFISNGAFEFLDINKRSKFDSTLAKCALKLDTQLLIKHTLSPIIVKQQYLNYSKNSPFLTYMKVSKNYRQNFYTVTFNKLMQEMYVHKEEDSKKLKISEQAREALVDLFYTKVAKIYAPVFLKNDTVIILNFQENLVIFLDKSGKILREVSLNQKDFPPSGDFEIIYDAPKQNFYLKDKEGDKQMIGLLNVYTGFVSKKIKLEKPFAKNVQVFNGHIYYLVKEKEWDDTRYLYQQNL
ncbi:MAG: hypothetical protein H0U95_00460 [Bacteroidetes bacterium]|nr:hypothetical protein [Bacteroidota bacterium]